MAGYYNFLAVFMAVRQELLNNCSINQQHNNLPNQERKASIPGNKN